jgi:thioredoxin 1
MEARQTMKCQPISQVPAGTTPPLPIEITKDSYPEAANRYKLLVIDCWAPWCVPCKQMTPIVEQLHESMRGKVTFGFLNTDEHQELAMQFSVMGIPTLLVVKDGKHVDSIVGVKPKGEVERRLKEHM